MAEFKMPSLGADMDAGTLVEWKKQPGEAVARGEIIAVVETEKGAIDVECWDAGVLDAILVRPGTKVPVGTVLATLRTGKEPVTPAPPPGPAAPEQRQRVSPAARKLAQDLGVELSKVRGTGAGGAIQREDVERAAAGAPPAAIDATAAMRRAISAAVARSKREIPHYYLSQDLDLTGPLARLERENAQRPLEQRILPAIAVLHAVARAAAEVPGFNGHFVDGAFKTSASVLLGVAVSLRPSGLVIAAIADAEKLALPELALRASEAIDRARSGKLRSSDLAPATLTVSNLGERGADAVHGVIFPPQVALVGVGRIAERAGVADGKVVPRRFVTLSLAADHRVTDGHQGSRFLAAIARHLEAP